MKLVLILALAVILGGFGCAKKSKDAPSDADGIVQADTAPIEAADNVETLPTIDSNEPAKESPSEPVKEAEKKDDGEKKDEPVVAEKEKEQSKEKPQMVAAPAAVEGSGQYSEYKVRAGDTLMKIAYNVYGDISKWKTIYELNKETLGSANQLTKGTKLKFEKPMTEPVVEKNGDPYKIKVGDTLGSIAYDIYAKRSKWKKIYENNRALIKNPNKIYAGFYLYYQITEQERAEAEAIRSKKTSAPAPIGSNTEQLPDSAANKPAPSATQPSDAGASNVKPATGLSSLFSPSTGGNDRAPASVPKTN